jgi:hypothetical protein
MVAEGMVLGDTVTDKHLRPLLPAGAVLTDENLHQLLAHQVEFVCVAEPEQRTQEEIDKHVEAVKARLDTVFATADRTASHVAALYAQVLAYRSV